MDDLRNLGFEPHCFASLVPYPNLMQRTRPAPPTPTAVKRPAPSFNVVIAYDDLESGKRAKRTCDFLASQLGRDAQCSTQMWKFEILDLPHLGQIAAEDAQAADVIIVACRGTEALPGQVKEWIDSWAARQPQALALIALFDPTVGEPEAMGRIRDYLASVARRRSMGFFSHPAQAKTPSTAVPGGVPNATTPTSAGTDLGSLPGGAQTETAVWPRWGINE